MNRSDRNPSRARGSVILRYLNIVTAWIYALLLNSAIGRYLTGYSRTSRAFADSGMQRLLRSKRKRADRPTFRLRQKLSAVIERSAFCKLGGSLQRALLRTGVSSYGVFMLFFGCYCIVAYYVTINTRLEPLTLSYAITGGLAILASLPLFASNKSLAFALRRSLFCRALLVSLFGIAEERLGSYGDRGKERYAPALFFAILLGSLTFLVPPYTILAVIGLVVLALVVLYSPEVGMLLSVGLCPFLIFFDHPTLVLLIMVGSTAFSYAIKLLCGKRVLRIQLMDSAIFLLLALFVFGGIVTRGGRPSLYSALTYAVLMLIYFMVSNMIRSQEGVRRMLRVLLISCSVVAILGLGQYFFSSMETKFVDMSLFSDLGGRVYSTFENPNMLAEYLALLLPLWLAVSLSSQRTSRRLGALLGLLLGAACLIVTWSRGAWLGTIVALLFFVLLLGHRALSYLLLCALPGAVLIPMLPERIVRRFTSIGSGVDSSIRYRRYLWEGVHHMLGDHWLTGVGVGENAFCNVYHEYALPGIETAVHSHNVYLQLLCGLGIVGLVVFAVAMLLWLRRALEYYRFGEWRMPRMIVLGGVAGVLALLVMGLFDDIFYNYRIFFLFWTLMGLVVAQLRIGEETSERAYNPVDNEKTQGEILFRFR